MLGVGKNNPLSRVICELIASAQQQLTICTPYFNLPLAVTREINRALARGVKIDIIVGDKTANDFYIPPSEPFKVIAALPYLYEISLRRFAKRHQRDDRQRPVEPAPVADGDNTYHLKGMWVDQRYTLLTGNNLNPRAFRLDLENALLIDDPQRRIAGTAAHRAGADFPAHPAHRALPGPANPAGLPGGGGEVSQAGEPGAD